MYPRLPIRALRRAAAAAALSAAITGVAGCASSGPHTLSWRSLGVYKIDINQGNYLSQDMVDKLKVGMTQQQVKQTLGTPLIESPFRKDRWDYVYEFSRQGEVREHRKFTVWFAESKLTRWDGDKMPQSVAELNRSATAKLLPKDSSGEGWWQRLTNIFHKP